MKTPQVPKWMRNLMMGIVALIWMNPTVAQAENSNGVSFQVFYDELMPYGDWVKDGRYGYVWLPAVQNEFHPYGTNGHWVMTAYGNTWVSDYDWGWATFHYGRWYFDDNYQSWAWIPDYDWGPAWVDWRTGGGYYGWAPMGPGFTVSMRIAIPAFHWIFVPRNRFVYHNVYSYSVPRARRVNIYNNTTIINNTVVYNNNRYYAGPARSDIERVTNRSYPERRIENSTTPGRTVTSRNAVRAYRPDLQSARGTTTSARPSRILSSGQGRTQPATSPSRGTSRSESVSGRSGTTSAAPSRSSERATAPNRSDNSGVRSTTPTTRKSEFETRPYSGSQTRTATPNRQSSSETRSSSPSTRSESNRQTQTRSTPTRTQSSAPAQRSNESRTQPAPTQRSTQPRTQSAPAQRSTQPRTQPAPSRSQSSSPARTAPTRTTQTRKAQPAPSRSTPQVKSTSSRSSAPAQSSRTSSGSSSSRSSSKTRGNN